MLCYATAVHAVLSHRVIFVNLTLPSSSVHAPLHGSVPPPQWISPACQFIQGLHAELTARTLGMEFGVLNQTLEEESGQGAISDAMLTLGLESWIGIRVPEKKAEVLAYGFWSVARGLVSKTARRGQWLPVGMSVIALPWLVSSA